VIIGARTDAFVEKPVGDRSGDDDCLEVRRGNNQNCSELFCLQQLCTNICTRVNILKLA